VKAVDIEWRAGAERFIARGGHGVPAAIDAPRLDPASRPEGPGPAEMLLAAAATCAAWDVVEILRKQNQAVDAIDVHAEGDQDADPPWTFRRIRIHFIVRGTDLDAAKVARAVELSESRYCSVISTIRGTADVSVTCEVATSLTRV
jgi:putative redox protein